MKNKTKGKLIITSYAKDKLHKDHTKRQVACFIADNQLEYLKVIPTDDSLPVGTILTGKIKNIVPNIQAAFVELDGKGTMGFLSLAKSESAVVTNRRFQGSLRIGDEVLVQIQREPIKTKEATLSTEISISGGLAVVRPGSGRLMFSKKLSGETKNLLAGYLTSKAIITGDRQLIGVGDADVIVRTEAEALICESSDGEGAVAVVHGERLLKDIADNLAAYRSLISQASMRTCHTVHQKPAGWLYEAYSELNACGYTVEEYVSEDISMVNELKSLVPDREMAKIRYYEDTMISLQALYGLDAKLDELCRRNVWLPSGGYLCIEPTEAMIVIDVNTGKAIRKGADSEALFAAINKEAAYEIARQLRLRNLSGMIVVDFINMQDKSMEQTIIQDMKQYCGKDFCKVQVYEFTKLGLLEMIRSKKSKALHELL